MSDDPQLFGLDRSKPCPRLSEVETKALADEMREATQRLRAKVYGRDWAPRVIPVSPREYAAIEAATKEDGNQ